jgi:hypothetical protein
MFSVAHWYAVAVWQSDRVPVYRLNPIARNADNTWEYAASDRVTARTRWPVGSAVI